MVTAVFLASLIRNVSRGWGLRQSIVVVFYVTAVDLLLFVLFFAVDLLLLGSVFFPHLQIFFLLEEGFFGVCFFPWALRSAQNKLCTMFVF